jgi:DNA-binding winged helix-turn-helix (wHTH) protein
MRLRVIIEHKEFITLIWEQEGAFRKEIILKCHLSQPRIYFYDSGTVARETISTYAIKRRNSSSGS